MKTRSNLKAVPQDRPESENPLIDGVHQQTLENMRDYACFLCSAAALSDDSPGANAKHGQYLAMRVLHDALYVVAEANHG